VVDILQQPDGEPLLSITLLSQKGQCFPAQVQAWAFKTKITLAVSGYIGMSRPHDES
jgi:hypothetical protein